jgi:hypothetical protein
MAGEKQMVKGDISVKNGGEAGGERRDEYRIRERGAMAVEGGRELRSNANEIDAHINDTGIGIWDCSQEPENGGEAGQIPNKENGEYRIRERGAMAVEGGRELRSNADEIDAHINDTGIGIWDCSQEPENGGEAGQIPNKEIGRGGGRRRERAEKQRRRDIEAHINEARIGM